MPIGIYIRTKPVWNKGLTKETSEILRIKAEKRRGQTLCKDPIKNLECKNNMSKSRKGKNLGHPGYTKGLNKENSESMRIMAEKVSIANTGCIPWNKSLTKETDPRIKKQAESISISMIGKNIGKSPCNKGLTKENCDSVKRQADSLRKKCKETDYLSHLMKAMHIKPNKPEIFLQNLLNELYPNEWEYTGDGKLVINGRIPDFANTNGEKKLIEHFGTYWHRDSNPQELIDHYRKYGYDTLIIWENELKDEELLRKNISSFVRGE